MSAGHSLLGLAARALTSVRSLAEGQRLSILIFHRVLPVPDQLFPVEVDAARFDGMMGTVARAFNVLPLPQAVQLMRESRLPPRALAITFDDGYADNVQIALPILQRHGLQATFFVSTGFLDGGRMWNDTVIESVRAAKCSALTVESLGIVALPVQSVAERRVAIFKLLSLIKYKDIATRDGLVREVHRACGGPELPSSLMMRSDEVQALHASGMEIGAHTVHHPILASISDSAVRQEMKEGRATLQQLTQAPVQTFAYPNGRPGTDYKIRHVAIARELGFQQAVTTAVGVARPGDDVFQLPRFTPWDMTLPKWATRLILSRGNTKFQTAGTSVAAAG